MEQEWGFDPKKGLGFRVRGLRGLGFQGLV